MQAVPDLWGPRISGSRLLHTMGRKQSSTSCQPGKRSTSKVHRALSTKCVLILHYHRVKTLHIESSQGWDGLSRLLVSSLKQFGLSKFLQLTACILVALTFITTFLKNIYWNKSRTMSVSYFIDEIARHTKNLANLTGTGRSWDHSGFCIIRECKRLYSPSYFPSSLLRLRLCVSPRLGLASIYTSAHWECATN